MLDLVSPKAEQALEVCNAKGNFSLAPVDLTSRGGLFQFLVVGLNHLFKGILCGWTE